MKCTLLVQGGGGQGVQPYTVVGKYDLSVEALVEWREGIDWIRGWHEEDSEDVRAMQAANMLAEDAPPRSIFLFDGAIRKPTP